MKTPVPRHSPVHDALERLAPRWGTLHGMPVALDFGRPEAEAEAVKTLALCDVTALPRVTVKGPGAERWLRDQGLAAPSDVYGVLPAGKDGRVARTGAAEFFLEGGVSGAAWPEPPRGGKETPGVLPVLRQDAAFLLAGARAREVMLETCGCDFSSHEPRMTYSRVAGVSCAILPGEEGGRRVFRIWCDSSYGTYLWDTLLEIVREKGGDAAGLAALYGRAVDGAPVTEERP
jgi:sarcosine oxidase subunit gamma